MNIILSCLILSFTAPALFSARAATSNNEYSVIGAIIDDSTRAGREAKVSIEMALHDISSETNQSFVRHIIDSQGEPASAALAARNLIDKEKVRAILGPHTWKEASLVVEVANRSYIPTLSLAGSNPKWATELMKS